MIELQKGIIQITGPSASGKTTLRKKLQKMEAGLMFSVSATTRPKRSDEVDGADYYFVSESDFLKMIQNNLFIEYVTPEQSQSGFYYGTLWSEIERIDNEGRFSLLDTDIKGAESVKRLYGHFSKSFYVLTNQVDRNRFLLNRGDVLDVVEFNKRLSDGDNLNYSVEETDEFSSVIDHVIRNGEGLLGEAFGELVNHSISFIKSRTA